MLLLALFLSGAASLVYQIAWTRELVTVTSAAASAQAFVLAVFMAGLGIGAMGASRVAARAERPLLAYAQVEAAAALLALGSFPVLRATGHLRDAAARLGMSPGAALASQLGLAAIYLLAATTLLGASLPLAIEHGTRAAPHRARGHLVAALYGVNTVGATIGCLAAGFVAVEHLGLTRTVAAGAVVALVAAAIAAGKVDVSTRATHRNHEEIRGSSPAREDAGATLDRGLILAAALAGLVGVGAEVVWTRLFVLVTFSTVYALTEVLAAVLIGIAIGSLLAGIVARRDDEGRATRAAGLASAIGAVLLGVVPHVLTPFAGDFKLQLALARGRSLGGAAALFACLVVASAAPAMVLPLLAAASRGAPARSFGALYAANIAGSVAGSLLAGFVLVPGLGIARAGVVLEGAGLAVAALLLARGGRSWRARIAPAIAAVACAVLHARSRVPRAIYEARLPYGVAIREIHEGVSSHVAVTEDVERHTRRLWINASWVASSGGPHRAFAHLPALLVASPRRVLGIALGTGQTFAAALDHGAAHLDCVDIDAGVVALSRRWFREENRGLLDDPRVSVHVEDGRAFLRAARSRYDLIVLEPLQAWSAGTSALYAREFYEEARRVLTPGGVVAQWIPFYGQSPDETRAMVRAGLSVFPSAVLWLAGRDGVIAFSNGPLTLPIATLDARLGARHVAPDPARLPIRSAADLLPFVLLGPEGLRRWTEGARLLTDDRPFLEFRAAAELAGEDRFAEIVRSALPHLDDLRPLVTETGGTSEERIDALLALRRAFVEMDASPEEPLDARMDRLQRLPTEAQRAPAWALRYGDALLGLAAQKARTGRRDEAAALYRRALALPARRAEAERGLAALGPEGR